MIVKGLLFSSDRDDESTVDVDVEFIFSVYDSFAAGFDVRRMPRTDDDDDDVSLGRWFTVVGFDERDYVSVFFLHPCCEYNVLEPTTVNLVRILCYAIFTVWENFHRKGTISFERSNINPAQNLIMIKHRSNKMKSST